MLFCMTKPEKTYFHQSGYMRNSHISTLCVIEQKSNHEKKILLFNINLINFKLVIWTPNSQPCKISYLSLLVLMVPSADSDSIKFGEFIACVSCAVDPKAVQNRNITTLRIDFILIYFLKTPIPNASSKPKIAAIFALLLLWSIA